MKMTMTVETHVNGVLKKQNKVIILNDLHIPTGRNEFRKCVMYAVYARKGGQIISSNVYYRVIMTDNDKS